MQKGRKTRMQHPSSIRLWPGFKAYRLIKLVSALGLVAGGALSAVGFARLAADFWSLAVVGSIDRSVWPSVIFAAFGVMLLYRACIASDSVHRRLASYCLRCGNDTWTLVSKREEESAGHSGDFGSPMMYSLHVAERYRCNTCGYERAERSRYDAYSRDEIERRRTQPVATHPDVRSLNREAERTSVVAQVDELEKAGDVDGLLNALDSDHARGVAALALGRLDAVQVVERLCQMILCEDRYSVDGYCAAECAAKSLETLGNVAALPRKVLGHPDMTGEERYRALYSLSQVPFVYIHREGKDRILRYSIPDIRRLCEEVLQTEPACEGARAVLDVIAGEKLLRPSARNQTDYAASLLRPDRGATTLQQEQFLRTTEMPGDEG